MSTELGRAGRSLRRVARAASFAALCIAACAPSERDPGPHDAGGVRDARTDALAVPDAAREDGGAAPDARDEDAPIGEDAPPTEDAPGGSLLEPSATCAPSIAACDAPAAPPSLVAGFRADHWLRAYTEDTTVPEHGGRVHVAATAALGGRVTRVLVDGVELASIERPPVDGTVPPFEWWHVWPERPRAGQPIWVSFHSRAARWDTLREAELVIETTMGEAVRGRFVLERTDAPISYVTTVERGGAMLVHLRNEASAPRTLARLSVNGRDVTESACIPERTLAPGGALLVRVPACAPHAPGDAYTVHVDWEGAPDAVAVGRVLPERFPIEAWNNTTDCPFPGGDADALAMHRAARIDTLYVHGGVCGRCGGCDTATLLGETLPGAGLSAIATSDLSRLTFVSTAAIAAFATGDESDAEVYGDDGVPVAAVKARESARAWSRHPEVPTFNGAMTNRNVGTFAGMADVQGIDLYVAACAPHITPFLMHPPLRAPYDYLSNARLNHRPLPTWLYTQGLSPVWNRGDPEYSVQPDPPEIVAQAMMAIAAGAKGLMWFQSNVGEGTRAPARWRAIGDVNAMVGSVRELLRSGDPIDASVEGLAIAEAIRAERAIVVPIVSLATSAGPDDLRCLTVRSEPTVPHWVFAETAVSVSIDVPADLGVHEVLEVTPGGVRPAGVPVRIAGRTLTLGPLPLDSAFPARLFVLAGDPTLASELAR